MWQVNIGQSILYYPGSEDATIYDTNLNEECGLAGEFTFKVPPTNPLYSSLVNGALVTILKDKKEYWRGEISDIKIDFAKIAEVYCVEDLAWLGQEYLEPVSITDQTFAQRFQAVIASYNSTRSSDRQFTAGYINNRTDSQTCRWVTDFEESILDNIRNIICGSNGYVRIRRQTTNGVTTRYVDVVSLENYGVTASQPIEYGYNLLNYVKDSDYGNLTNVLTPYGDELDTEIYSGKNNRLKGTVISNADSITAYGRHAKAVVFDGVTNLDSLNALASSYLSRYCQPQLTMEVSAVDLAEVGEADSFNIGDSVRVIAKPFAVDQRLYLTQIQRDIQNIDKNTITLSGHVVRRSLTSQMLSVTDAVESLPSESDILKAAKRNALAMLLDETQGGYVVYEYDSGNQYITAINICNARTIEASTKRWRWSQNGFGYMHRNNITDSWSNLEVAITIDGAIVANFITSGTLDASKATITNINASNINTGDLNCDRLNGGTISGQSISGGTVHGTTITGSTININERFKVSNQGRVFIKTQGSSSQDDYLVIEDPSGKQTYIGGEYIYSTGAAESVKIADLINYYINHR